MGRQEAVYELIDTEGDYVKDLGVVLDVHLRRLRESNLIQEAQIGQIFSNLPSIYTASSVRADGRDCVRPLAQAFYQAMKARRTDRPVVDAIGDILVEHVCRTLSLAWPGPRPC